MLIDTMLFLHLAGLSVWLGSILSLAIVTLLSRNHAESGYVRSLVRKITGAFSSWIHPSAIVVLVSGIILIANMYSGAERPFWLDYMEMAGMTIIFLSMIVLGLFSNRKVRKPLAVSNGETATIKKGLSVYFTLLMIFMILILSVIFVVAFKF